MRVDPYKLTPVPPRVAYLTPEGVPVGEGGETLSFDAWPPDVRLWASFDVARLRVQEGHGEALCWNGEEVRWRHRHVDEPGWSRRPSDALVIRAPFEELRPEQVVKGLGAWRDWLGSYGAAPTGTLGSSAWSLLRARLERTLWTPSQQQVRPPLPFTLGGRQEIGPRGPGCYTGRLEHLDLQAAYARTLGGLEYGGWWKTGREFRAGSSRELWALGRRLAVSGRPLFVRARVELAGAPYGPLPRRPRSSSDPWFRLGLGAEYPTRGRLQGVWTWQELEAALESGAARRADLFELWAHFAGGWRPFEPWLEAVERGRRLRGLGGLLAKMTGNALVGRFSMRSSEGHQAIRSRHGRQTALRPVTRQGTMPAAHDLAETVTGRIRAELFRAMLTIGDELLAAHTDGGWRSNDDGAPVPSGGWRVKEQAAQLELLGPQTLRYQPLRGERVPVVSGVPKLYADAAFDRLWREAFP